MASYNCVLIVLFIGMVAIMGIERTTATTNSSDPETESTEPTGSMNVSEEVTSSGTTDVAASTNSSKEPTNISIGVSSSASTVVAASTNASKEPMLLECKCTSRLNEYGKGNCTTKSWSKSWRGGKTWCYVAQPSDCRDLQNSTVIEVDKYSAKACPSKGRHVDHLCHSSKKTPTDIWFKYLVDGVIKICMGVFGIFMNSIAIWILVTAKKMQSMFLHILAFSFVCDNGYLLAEILSTMYYEFKVEDVMWFLPYFAFPFKEIFYTANILITIALSRERYSLVTDNHGYRAKMEVAEFRYERLKKYIAVMTIFSVVINIPSFCTYSISNVNVEDGNTLVWKMVKTALRKDDTYVLLDKAVKWSIILVISFVLLVFLNRKVYTHVKEKMALRTSIRSSTASRKTSFDQGSTFRARWNFIMKLRKTEKFTLALFAVVAAFLFCNVWYLVEVILKAISSGIIYDCMPKYGSLSRFMRTFNACTNVLIYCFADRTFKRYLKNYLCYIIDRMSCGLIKLQTGPQGDRYDSGRFSQAHSSDPGTPSIKRALVSRKISTTSAKSASSKSTSSAKRSSSKSTGSAKRSSTKSTAVSKV